MSRFWVNLILAALLGSAALAQTSPPDSGRPGSAPGAIRTITIQGRVVPTPGQPQMPEMMTVTLSEFSGGVIQTRLVRSGLFEFRGLTPGRYIVRVECQGYQTVEGTVDLQPSRSNRNEFVQLNMGARLEPRDSAPPPGDTIVSAELLSVPEKAQKELQKAQESSRGERYEQAVRHLKKALKIHPAFPEAYNNLAVQYLRLGREQEALEALTQSLQLRPTAQAHQNLGVLRMNQGQYQEAAQSLFEAHQMDPEDGQTMRSLGELFFRVGQYQMALEWLNKVSDDDDAMLALARGHCHLRLEHYGEALRHFEDYLQLAPGAPQAKETRKLAERIRKEISPP